MKNQYEKACAMVLQECQTALGRVAPSDVEAFITKISTCEKVFFVGVGRVKLSLEAMAKRLAHIGIHTVVVGQVTEPAITDKDVLVVGSGSGETLFPVGIAKKAKSFGAAVVHIGSNPESSLKEVADLFVRIPVESKMKLADEVRSVQPMTSLFEQCLLLFGDVVAKMILDQKEIELDSLWEYHANLE